MVTFPSRVAGVGTSFPKCRASASFAVGGGVAVVVGQREEVAGGIWFPLHKKDLIAAAAKLLWPVLAELIRQAAQGSVMHNDDTGPGRRLPRAWKAAGCGGSR
jgi:hypothetical protein